MSQRKPFAKFQHTLQAIAQKLAEHNYTCYVVGGAIRDFFLEKDSLDVDLSTDAPPNEIIKIFKHAIPTGIAHGTVTILYHNTPFEITTFRNDGSYEGFRSPNQVTFLQSIDEDLKRRDFTINAIAYHILTNQFHDPLKGFIAITNKKIEAIGNPEERLKEDVLRILRGIRFLSQLDGFSIEQHTAIAMKNNAQYLIHISRERITKELNKILTGKRISHALQVGYDLGIWSILFPEINFYHNKFILPNQTIWKTLLIAIDKAESTVLYLHVAILLCALGELKPSYNSDQVIYRSAKLATDLLSRYKVNNELKAKVAHLIRYQELILLDLWSDEDIRRWLSQVKIEHAEDIISLNKALYQACMRDIKDLNVFSQRVKAIIAEHPVINIYQLAINGSDLIALGVPEGKQIGELLQQLLELVLDNPQFNTRTRLIHAAKFFMST